jgi:hypothetical protein
MTTRILSSPAVHVRLPWASGEVGARLHARRRRRLADDLERLLTTAQAAHDPLSPAVAVQRAEILATRSLLLELARQIRQAEDSRPAALIPARRLLTDGTGPVFAPSRPGTLWDSVEQAMLAVRDARTQAP